MVDARRCLAWLLQRPGPFPREWRVALGDRMYGCDDCQEVCPPNLLAVARRELPVAPENWPGVRENFARIAAFARLTTGLQLAYVDLPAPVFEPESRN